MMPRSIAAWRSTWSEPMPAVIASFSFVCLGDAFGGQIGGPERLRDHDLGIRRARVRRRLSGPSLSEVTTRLWPSAFEELSQAQFAGHAAEQDPRLKIDGFRCGKRLAAWIALKLREAIARVTCRISVDRIVIEDANDLCHFHLPSPESEEGGARVHRSCRSMRANSRASSSVDLSVASRFAHGALPRSEKLARSL